ncbi:MAG: DUF2782 domain-containing protein [Betaproteobacteria bacterium]|jgi:hypothetical protein|nr:MAG: DUF2782 domain-containing protein [Betaproteobacteria bacterium]
MRYLSVTTLAAIAVGVALTAAAQKAPPPPKLEPVPEPPPPPAEIANDPELEPQITIVRRDNETIEEYRVSGRLTMVKVTPRHGRPYYLVADGADGTFIRRDSLDTGLRVPLWVLFSF